MLAKTKAASAFLSRILEELAYRPPIPAQAAFPYPQFAAAYVGEDGKRFPQCIGHRGYRAKYPENSMLGFEKAIETGVHAIETDVHLTKDGVVVLSHDPSLKRCFGLDRKIIECEWKEISDLRSIEEPHTPMARLVDLLEFMTKPGMERKWILLDIKIDDDADEILRHIAAAFDTVKLVESAELWESRVVLGFWAAKYIPLCYKYLPGFPIAYIGAFIKYARQFLDIPNVGFNVLQAALISPGGLRLLEDAKERERPVYAWTVNDDKAMDWCIRKDLDGVITDDPQKFLDACKNFDVKATPPPWPPRVILGFIVFNCLVSLISIFFEFKYGIGLTILT